MAAAMLLAILCCNVHAQESETLTNKSVVDLVKNGIGSDVIVKMIGQQPHHFDLSSSAIIRLKQQGVPQTVLKAMLNAQSSPPAAKGGGEAAATPAAAPAAHNKTPNYTWKNITRNDPMTGSVKSTLVLDTPAVTEDGERVGDFEAQATCNSSQLNINIVFGSDAKPGNQFKQNTTTYYETGGLLGAMANASHHKKPWTETRVRVGDAAPVIGTSEADYLNESDLYFLDQDPRNANQQDAGIVLLGAMMTANKPVGLAGDFFSAQKVLFESTFDNGAEAVLEIHPQDPSFRPFAENCISIGHIGERVASSTPSYGAPRGSSTAAPSAPRPPAPPRVVLPTGSTLQVTLTDPVTLDATRTGAFVHGTLAEAMQTSNPPAGQTVLALPAGTDVYLRGHVIASGQQYQVRLDLDHVLVHGTNVVVRANTVTRTAPRENSGPPVNVNLGGYGRLNFPHGSAASKGDQVLVKKNEQLTFNTSQTTFVPASVSH